MLVKLFVLLASIVKICIAQIEAKNARFVRRNTNSINEERVFRASIFTTRYVQKRGCYRYVWISFCTVYVKSTDKINVKTEV